MRAFISKIFHSLPPVPLIALAGMGMITYCFAATFTIPIGIGVGGFLLILAAIDAQLDLGIPKDER